MKILGTFVQAGAIHEDHIGPDMSLLTYADGTVRFRHLCDRERRGIIISAPAIQVGPHGNGHALTRSGDSESTPTVTPSILCEDCGTHGFLTDGRWSPC